MSKSNHKKPDRLKDSIRREKLRRSRHDVKKLLKEGHLEDLSLYEDKNVEVEKDG